MKKNPESRKKAAPVQDKDLLWVKGSSGYMIIAGDQEDPPPPDGEG